MSEEKYEQMSLFDMNEDGSEGNAAGLHVVESHTLRSENTESTSANMVRCYAYSFLAVTVREPVELTRVRINRSNSRKVISSNINSSTKS